MPQKNNFSILLHDIRSVQNVASVFRLADCIGAEKIFLSGTTPAPVDRFGRKRADFIKISLGSEDCVSWDRLGEEIVSEIGLEDLIERNKKIVLEFTDNFEKSGGKIILLEQDSNAIDYKDLQISEAKNYLIIPGREREGMEEFLLNMNLEKTICEIPQYGKKESLNIFSSLAVVLYRWFDK